MLHVANEALQLAAKAPDITNWKLHLVLHWQDGEALTDSQQAVVANNVAVSEESGITAIGLEAKTDIPYAYVDLDVSTSFSEILAEVDEDESLTEIGYEWQRKEVALSKGISYCLGRWVCTGIELEDIELETAYIAEVEELASAHADTDNPDMYITSKEHCVDAFALRVFRDEKEKYEELEEFLRAA